MPLAYRGPTGGIAAATLAIVVACSSPSTPGAGGTGSQVNPAETSTGGSDSAGAASTAPATSSGGAPTVAAGGTTPSPAGGAADPGTGGTTGSNTAGMNSTGVAGTSQGGVSGGPSGAAGEVTSGDGPRFLTLGSNIQTLIWGESVVLSAVLTDPDGIDDLIGGTLVDPDSGATYGTFMTAASEGSYSLTLSWSAIDQVATINSDPLGVERTFRAEFFDQAGNKSTQEIAILLKCSEGNAYGCCNGKNVFFNGDLRYNGDVACGSCEERSTGSSYACYPAPDWAVGDSSGICLNFRCAYPTVTTELTNCSAACAALDLSCTERGDYADINPGTARYDESSEPVLTCDAVPAAALGGAPFTALECYCGGAPPDYFAEIP